MTRIQRWSVITYGSLQAEFTGNRHNGHTHMYETPIFGNIVIYVSIPINNDNYILCWLYNIVSFDMKSVLFTSKATLL